MLTRPTSRAERRKQAQNRILDAAMQLLSEHDYGYLSVANVCKVAGISTGTFYHYFSSIDELSRAFFIRAFEIHSEEREAERTGNPLNDLKLFFHSYFRFCEQQGIEFVRHFYDPRNTSLYNEITPNADEHFALPSLQETEHFIMEAQHQGILREDADPLVLAGDICTIEKGIMMEWCVSSGAIDALKMADRIVGGYLDSWRRLDGPLQESTARSKASDGSHRPESREGAAP